MPISQPTYPITTSGLVDHVGAYTDDQLGGGKFGGLIDVSQHGMVPNVGGYYGSIFQGIIDLAQTAGPGGTEVGLYFPPGSYNITDDGTAQRQFEPNAGQRLVIVGPTPAVSAGDCAVTINCGDPGLDAHGNPKYVIRMLNSSADPDPGFPDLPYDESAAPWVIENVSFVGPGSGVAFGDLPSVGNGVRFSGKGICRGVGILGFRAGACVHNDHQRFFDVYFQGNGYNMLWEATNGLGDQMVDNFHLESASIAGIGIHCQGAILQASFRSGHFGNSPYGIYRFGSTGGRSQAMAGVTMTNVSFEGCGNGNLFDESIRAGSPLTDSAFEITFLFYGESAALGANRWAGKASHAIFEAPTLNLTFVGRGASEMWNGPTDGSPDTGGLDLDGTTPINRVPYCMNTGDVRLDTAGYMGTVVAYDAVVFRPGPDVGAPMVTLTTPLTSACLARAQTGVTQFDLLSNHGDISSIPYSSDEYAFPKGVAARTAEAGEWFMRFTSGKAGTDLSARVASGVSVGSGKLVKPDASNPGHVVEATNALDGPIVGRAKTGVAGPSTVQLELFPLHPLS
jgi:hypothetical protein